MSVLVADPPVTDAVPTSVDPSRNWTVPAAAGVTVAVSKTVAGAVPVVGLAASDVDVPVAGRAFTTYGTVPEVEPAKVAVSVGVKVAV